MIRPRVDVAAISVVFFFTTGALEARADLVSFTAVISDRGADLGNDGVFDTVFGNNSVVQVFAPPPGTLTQGERTAIEFDLGTVLNGATIDTVTLQLSPQGNGANLGVEVGETGRIHGYIGDGAIQVADLNVSNLVASIPGPTANGAVLISLLASWLQGVVDSSLSPFAGLMFAIDPIPMDFAEYSFSGTYSGIDPSKRPILNVEFHTNEEPAPIVPEPGTLLMFGTGVAAMVARGRRRQIIQR